VSFRLCVALSPHGFGHAAMTLPILNKIKEQATDLDLIIYSNLPRALLKSRIGYDFEYIEGIDDFGLIMNSAVSIDLEASAAAYNQRHLDWQNRLEAETERLKSARADLLLANIPYLTLAAARRLKLPAIALSSLNWYDIFMAYLGDRPEAGGILERILDSYAAAHLFLRITPGLPMDRLAGVTRLIEVGPSARLGRKDGSGLRQRFQIADQERVGLVAYGGIESRLPVENWPRLDGWTWLVPAGWNIKRADFRGFETAGGDFPDILCSSDLVVTKPGYGTFTEAACNGVAVLAQERPDWPETPYFDAWMRAHARYRSLAESRILAGEIGPEIEALMAANTPICPQPHGTAKAAAIILEEIEKLR
jgi:hypothetical protein